jgi:molybdopterin converting factor small subunit
MMKIKVEFKSWLSEMLETEGSANPRNLEMDVEEDSTVKQLLLQLAARYPRFRQSAFDSGLQKLNENICVFRNDRLLELDNGLQTALSNGDEIVFIPIFQGG